MALFPNDLLFTLAAAAMGTAAAVVALERLAGRVRLIDHPGEHRNHERPVPLVGGIAIFAGLALAFAVSGKPPIVFLAPALLLVVVGAIDDAFKLNAGPRLAAQAIAASLMILLGHVELRTVGDLLGNGPIGLWIFVFPMTVFAAVGVINSANMIDGMDGLTGSVAAIAFVWYATAAGLQGLGASFAIAATLAASVAAFLYFNQRLPHRAHARVFLGDAGSTLIGFGLAWLAIDLTQGEGRTFPPICALWVVLLPLVDCVSLMARRIAAGRSPFAADSQHIHHYLRARGLSHAQTLAVLTAASAAFGAVGFFGWRLGVPQDVLFWTFFFFYFAYHFWIQRAWRAVERPAHASSVPQAPAEQEEAA